MSGQGLKRDKHSIIKFTETYKKNWVAAHSQILHNIILLQVATIITLHTNNNILDWTHRRECSTISNNNIWLISIHCRQSPPTPYLLQASINDQRSTIISLTTVQYTSLLANWYLIPYQSLTCTFERRERRTFGVFVLIDCCGPRAVQRTSLSITKHLVSVEIEMNIFIVL